MREFQRKPVPDEVIQDILEVARWSGSASNRQFGEIIVVRDRQRLHALAGLGGYVSHLRDAALAMLLVMPGEWPEGETFDEGRLAVQAKPVLRTAIAFGYPAKPARRGARKPLNELVHEERYRA